MVLAKRARDLGDDPDVGATCSAEAVDLAGGEVRTSIWRRAVAWSAILAAEAGRRRAGAAARGRRAPAARGRAPARGCSPSGRWPPRSGRRATDAGALATLDAVLGRFRDRPLAFLAVVRDELRDLED